MKALQTAIIGIITLCFVDAVSAQCVRDGDCNAGMLCISGVCQSASPPAAPAPVQTAPAVAPPPATTPPISRAR